MKCTQPLPIPLPDLAECQFHRVVVALGASERCKKAGETLNGSIHLNPSIVGKAHCDTKNATVQPFHFGKISDDSPHIHLFDDFTLPLVLSEVDTLTDFVEYLEFKEQLFESTNIGVIAGEENLLAFYLSEFVHGDEWAELQSRAQGEFVLSLKDTAWQEFTESKPYRVKKGAHERSYIWDNIINEFATHSFGGTLIEGPKPIEDNEYFFRHLAKESRFARGYLTSVMLERWLHFEEGRVDYRVVQSPANPKLLYAFVFVPNECDTEAEYRETRQEYLMTYCFLVARQRTDCEIVLGVATQSGNDLYRTFDVFGIENGIFTADVHAMLDAAEIEYGVTGLGTVHRLDPRRTSFFGTKN